MKYDDSALMGLAWESAKNSPCRHTKVGALLSCNCEPVTSACNGNPLCLNSECLRIGSEPGCDLEFCRGVHAEQKLMMTTEAGYFTNLILYTTHFPCGTCARSIAYSGINEVVYSEPYINMEVSLKILEEAGVKVRRYYGPIKNFR